MITETHLGDESNVELEGYCTPFANNRNEMGGGVLIAVREELKNITVEVKRSNEHLESLWILINNDKTKLRIGAVYFPQEKDQKLKEIYEEIKEQVEMARNKEEALMIVGDFNCKVGNKISGNREELTKGGKKLIKVLEKENLVLGNSLQQCDGIWTREENGRKSILDYVVMDEKLCRVAKSIKIYDKSKEMSPFNIKKEAKEIKIIYSDHNPIIIEVDLITMQIQETERKKKTVMTEDGYTAYRNELQSKEISKMWDEVTDTQQSYNAWNETVIESKTKHETVRNMARKRKSKTMRILMNEKKKLKLELKNDMNTEGLKKLEKLKEQIVAEENERNYRKMEKACQEIRKHGKFDGGGLWKLKNKLDRRREENMHAVTNKEGELKTEREEILDAYREFYEDLLTITTKKTTLPENKETVKKVEDKFSKIMERGAQQKPLEINEDEMEEIVRGLKKRKARDTQGWNNELLIEGGSEMIRSLTKMTNTMLKEEITPAQWNHMMIKSIHKKGEKEKLNNKRGLFLTNIISKVFEKVIDMKSTLTFDSLQHGGCKRRGTIDNWLIMMAVIDEGKRLNKPVYLFFGDLVKCFDRLWLKDCINDLYDCGMRERELRMVYKLNAKAIFNVSTPAGVTKEITVEEIVKQGTVFGPKLCCASTGKINEGLNKKEVIYPGSVAQAATFVDDINGNGRKEFVEAVMMNASRKEREKLWEFSTDKSKWMCIEGRKKDAEEISVEIKQGKIERTKKYKYVGNIVNDKGNMDEQLELMKDKASNTIREINRMCARNRVGIMEMEAKIFIYNMVGLTSVFHNIEGWSNMRKGDMEKLECLQGKILKGIFGLPKSTPYWGLLFEIDVWPIRLTIIYKRMMLYHNLVNSDKKRFARELIINQEMLKIERCWFANAKDDGMSVGLELSEDAMRRISKEKWKETVKEKINIQFQHEVNQRRTEEGKMRFLHTNGINSYLKEVYNEQARIALKIRLNMIEWIGGNYGVTRPCNLCGEEDTTEHVFACKQVSLLVTGDPDSSTLQETGANKHVVEKTEDGDVNMRDTTVTVKDLENGKEMKEIVGLFKRTEERRKQELLEDIVINCAERCNSL